MTKKYAALSFLSLSLVVSASLFSTSAVAQTYKWKDASGNTIVSTEPPPANTPGVSAIAPSSTDAASTPDAATAKSLADKELEFRQRQLAEEKAAEQEAKAAEQKRALAENCDRAKKYLDTLNSGQRTATRNEQGEIVPMDDEMRAQETAKVQADYDRNCVTQENQE